MPQSELEALIQLQKETIEYLCHLVGGWLHHLQFNRNCKAQQLLNVKTGKKWVFRDKIYKRQKKMIK